MKYCSFLFLLLTFFSYAQDIYHQNLLNSLEANYGLTGGSWVFHESEIANNNSAFNYGCDRTVISANNQDFSQILELDVSNPGENPWNNAIGLSNINTIQQGDKVLLVVWVRSIEAEIANGVGSLIFEENVDPYGKDFIFFPPLRSTWLQFLIPFEAQRNYAPGEGKFTFHIGQMQQKIQIAGLTAINYGTSVSLDDLPQQIHNDSYEGQEANAPWRDDAADRIEQYRKANLEIKVVDQAGNPVDDATIEVEMLAHDFAFGTAVVGCRIANNSCFNSTYQEKLLDLDGEGHGFNYVVFENDMKWDGWEEQWIGTPESTANAATWLAENNIRLRGHTLLWPSCSHVPNDVCANINNPDYVLNRHQEHMETIMTYPGLGEYVEEWDVLNEITGVREMEYAFANTPQYETGREFYPEVFEYAHQIQPEIGLYLNDYVTLAGGGFNQVAINRYQSFIQEIVDSGAPISGLGFQSHLAGYPVAPTFLYELFDDYYQKYGLDFKITEYDFINVSDELAGQYLGDYLTVLFSHPAATGFLMWGFWDGNHWLDNAPLFYQDWSIKPAGEVFIQKIYNDWWTPTTNLTTDQTGVAQIRGFKGQYVLKYTCNGQEISQNITLKEDMVVEIQECVLTSNLSPIEDNINIYPIPANEKLFIQGLDLKKIEQIEIYASNNTKVQQCAINTEININHLPNGIYTLRIVEGSVVKTHKFVIKK